jgi:hypothetical protein
MGTHRTPQNPRSTESSRPYKENGIKKSGNFGLGLAGFRFVKRREFPLGRPLNGLIFPGELIIERLLGFGVPKGANHTYGV